MRWWWRNSSTSAAPAGHSHEDELHEANNIINALFSPAHAPLTSSTAARDEPPQKQQISIPHPPTPSPTTTTNTTVVAAPSSSSSPALQRLPPCPIQGFSVDPSAGLRDDDAQPSPHVLTGKEVRQLIARVSVVEQETARDLDAEIDGEMGVRQRHGLELALNPCLWAGGIYCAVVKPLRHFHNATPRASIIFSSRILSRMCHTDAMTAHQREVFARRHRTWLMATNPRVCGNAAAGALMLLVAAVSRPDGQSMSNAPDIRHGHEVKALQQHTEQSLRWLWYIYHHHPAYAEDRARHASSLRPVQM